MPNRLSTFLRRASATMDAKAAELNQPAKNRTAGICQMVTDAHYMATGQQQINFAHPLQDTVADVFSSLPDGAKLKPGFPYLSRSLSVYSLLLDLKDPELVQRLAALDELGLNPWQVVQPEPATRTDER